MKNTTRNQLCVSLLVVAAAATAVPAARGADLRGGDDVASLELEVEQLRQEVQALRASIGEEGGDAVDRTIGVEAVVQYLHTRVIP